MPIDGRLVGLGLAGLGLVRGDEHCETRGFDVAAVRLELNIDLTTGSLDLDPARECAG